MTDHVLPFNLEAEEHVVGACLTSDRAIDTVSEILQPDHLHSTKLRTIYQACLDARINGQPVDPILLNETLDTETSGRVRELVANAYTASNVAHHAQLVRDTHTRRRLIGAGQDIARLGWEPDGPLANMADQAERIIRDLDVTDTKGDLIHVRETLDHAFTTLARPGGEITGTPTGLTNLDRITAGFHPGQLVIVAARPGMGKSALVTNQAIHVAVKKRLPVAIFSFEMSADEITQRLLSQLTRINLHRIRTRTPGFSPADWNTLEEARQTLHDAPIYIDDTATATLTDIRTRCRRRQAANPDLALIVTDYLQLMLGEEKAQNRNLEIAALSRGLKIIARELAVPVVALSQLSRAVEYRHDKRPMLSDLRDSGAVEQDADVVIFIYRDGYYTKEDDATAELIVGKHRNGPTGAPLFRWAKETAEFQNLEEHH